MQIVHDYCPECDLHYTSLDKRSHNARHQRWMDASAVHGVVRGHGELEHAKRAAWGLIHADRPLEEKVQALIAVVRAHFERSLSAGWFRKWRSHPDFATYAAAYDVPHVREGFPEIWSGFRSLYPAKPSRRLQPGFTYWE